MNNAQYLTKKVPSAWHALIAQEFSLPYWAKLSNTLQQNMAEERMIYPKEDDWFSALKVTSPEKVRVVILGQDPYHGPKQAHGLSFSVPNGVAIPPSLKNIYKEIQRDLGIPIPKSGELSSWAQQGVLLLNAILTVEAQKAGSHRAYGWEEFTDAIIHGLATQYEHIVFMLWGSFAQAKAKLIPKDRHCILQSPHPSPLSAYRGFIGNHHFSEANRYLAQTGRSTIDWQIQ